MERIAAADYHDLVQVSDPRVAPDGDGVAFVRTVPDDGEAYEASIYRVPLEGGDPERFTREAGVDSQPRFSPDGDRLAFVSSEDEDAQVWVVPTDGGEASRLTDVPGDPEDLTWAPDGTRLAFTQRVTATEREAGIDRDRANADADDYEREPPDPAVIDRTVYRSREDRWFHGTHRQVYLLDVADGTVTRVTAEPVEHGAPAWGDETTLYYVAQRGEDPDDSVAYDVDAYDTAAGEAEQVFTTTGFPEDLAATADGRIAHYFSPEEQAGLRQGQVHVYDRETGETHTATAPVDRQAGAFQWGPDDESLYVVTPDEGRDALHRLDWTGAAHEVVHREGTLEAFHVGEDRVAFVQSQWDHPGDVFVADADGGGAERLTDVNRAYLEAHAVAEPEELVFESDGHEIQGWVLTPPDADPDETHPLAVEIHGGPHIMWSTAGSTWHEFQTLAARGYAVFWCNPRGSAGYGADFMAANERDWGAVTMADVLAGADLVAERDDVDADSQFVTGGSFGGYTTGWLVGHTDRFDAAVAQRGVYDLLGFYGATDQAYKLVEWDFGTTPTDEPEFLWAHSPVAHADEVSTPTLLLHAEEDYRVPVNDAELFYRLLRTNGVDTRFVRYPREGHDLSRGGEPAHVVDRIERIARWFDGYSPHHDAAPALERGAGADLTAPED